jgi:hypothetical protein
MDIIIYDACDGYCDIYDACCDIYDGCDGYCVYVFWDFLDVKTGKKLGQFVVRRGAGARQIDPKWLPQQEICRAPGATHDKLTILCRAPRHKTNGNGTGAPAAWTILCRAPSGTTHGKGHGPPCI